MARLRLLIVRHGIYCMWLVAMIKIAFMSRTVNEISNKQQLRSEVKSNYNLPNKNLPTLLYMKYNHLILQSWIVWLTDVDKLKISPSMHTITIMSTFWVLLEL